MKLSKVPTFVVGDDPDPVAAKKAFRDLRRMVSYGKLAKKALEKLETVGFYDGNTPVVAEHGSVRAVNFGKRLPISRNDLSDMAGLQISFGRYNPQEKEVSLYITGPMTFQVSNDPLIYEVRDARRDIGSVRINKNNVKITDRYAAPYRVYKEMKYAAASLELFSKQVSRYLVDIEETDDENVVRRGDASAKTSDLNLRAWEWFLEDGHAERMFKDILQQVSILQVMES